MVYPMVAVAPANFRLRVFDSIQDHDLKRMLDLGLCVTVNPDDPAYFGGCVVDNFRVVREGVEWSRDDIYRPVKNLFRASFLDIGRKQRLLDKPDDYCPAS